MLLGFLIFPLLWAFSLGTKLHQTQPPSRLSILHQIQSRIDAGEIISPESYKNFLSFFAERKFFNHSDPKNNSILAKSMVIYGKLLLYGLIPNEIPDVRRAAFFFKMSAHLGSSHGLYYDSFLSFFQLDGTLALRHNLSPLFSDSPRLMEYLQKRARVNSFINTYFSSLQNQSEALLAIGYKYLHGLNGNSKNPISNCPSSAIYYHEINKQLYLEHETFIPKFIEKKRLSLEGLEAEIRHNRAEEHEEIEFLRMQGNQNKIEALLKLAYYYFYGLKGLSRNYEQAFEHFSKASYLGDISAKTSLGYMHLKGLGTSKNYQAAYKEFNDAVLKKDARAKCGLGLLYMNGWGVDKNEKIAMNYYKEAADAGNAEGQYLYGSYLISSSQKALSKQAYEYINLAAHQGHAAAMYALGLLHLDGNNMFYSCEVAVGMMKSAAERGPWADKMKTAYLSLTRGQKRLSFLLYLESAYLGLSNSAINSALIADKFDVFRLEELDFSSLEEILLSDPVYKILKEKSPNSFKNIKVFDFFFDDILQVLPTKEPLKKALKNPPSLKILAKQAYTLAKLEKDPFSLLRLGDFYFYGIAVKQDYEKAYKSYVEVLKLPIEDVYQAQAYFNIAYMHQYGLGTSQDLNKSWIFYNKTYELNKYALFSVKMSQFLLGFQGDESDNWLFKLETWRPTPREIYAFIIGVGIFVWMAVEILRLRQKNLIDSMNVKFE